MDHTGADAAMVRIIDQFAELRGEFERRAAESAAIPLEEVRLLPPLPRPGKILCSTASYAELHLGERAPLLLTLKSAESVIGPGQTVQLPTDVGDQWQFVAEAELGLVIRGPAKRVAAADWRCAVVGYTCVIDVMARGDTQFGRDFWLAKADTLGPLGPCIVTTDEILDPAGLRVTSFVNDQPGQDYRIADADYSLAEQVELSTSIMTLHTGDVIACGTARQGLRPLADGDDVRVQISGIGSLDVHVSTLATVGG